MLDRMATFTGNFKRNAILAVAVSSAAFAATTAARAATPFDGNWSVSIITDNGDCDRGYRYALRIENGRVSYDNPSFDISGQVNPRGQVRVVVRAGSQEAIGNGRLSRDTGQGVWSGHSPTSQCSGHWEAERR
jgi:outer membrane protein assembly factor BamB